MVARSDLLNFTVLTAMVLMISVSMVVLDTDATEADIIIDEVYYDNSEGSVFFTGKAESQFVSARVVGDGILSQIDSCSVIDGEFSDSFFVGHLKDGTYRVEVWYGGDKATKAFMAGDILVVESVSYNRSTGQLSYKGTTSLPFVNVALYHGDDMVSPVTTSGPVGGLFDDAIYVGVIEPGTYVVRFNYDGAEVCEVLTVSERDLQIDSITFVQERACITIIGHIYSDVNPCLIVKAPSGLDYETEYWQDEDGSFVAYAFMGKLQENGVYTLSASAYYGMDPIESTYADYHSEDQMVDSQGNVLIDNGHTLVSFSGVASTYVIPASVTHIMEGAFEGSKIGTFILDRDVTWDIRKYEGMTFTFQDSDISRIIIKEGVSVIPDYLFAKTKIETIEFPASIKTIGVKSFYDCNDLVSITFRDNNCLTELKDYSFAYDEKISSISFGGSRFGYKCEIGTGAFIFCNDLTQVTLQDGFYLRTIGSFSFTKLGDRFKNPNPTAISFNTTNGILIPDETVEIGQYAFSTIAYNDVVMSEMSYEPLIGYVNVMFASIPTIKIVGDNWQISVEEGSQLTSIEVCAFAGYNDVKSIDLSECKKLLSIQKHAFSKCLNNGVLKLPPNVEEIYSSFMYSTTNHDIVLPNSIRVLDSAFDGVHANITATEGSLLEYFSESIYSYYNEDFSHCTHLTYVKSHSDNVRILPGVYDGEIVSRTLDQGVMPNIDGDSLEITDNTTYMCWAYTSKQISCSDNNPYFKIIDNALYYVSGGQNILMQVAGCESFNVIDGAYVRSGILKPYITDLSLSSHVILESGSISQCDSLITVRVSGDIDPSMLESAFQGIKTFPTILLDGDYSDSDILRLSMLGSTYYGLHISGKMVYVPTLLNNVVMHYGINDDYRFVRTNVVLEDHVLLITSGLVANVDGSDICIDDISDQGESFIWFVPLEADNAKIIVDLNFDGGNVSGKGSMAMSVDAGLALSEWNLSTPVKDRSSFEGWSLTPGGALLPMSYRVGTTCTLFAVWSDRDPMIIVDDSVASVYQGDSRFDTQTIVEHQNITLSAQPKAGFELVKWVVNGDVTSIDASTPLILTDVTSDYTVSFTSRYYSSSSGIQSVVDRGLPTIEDASNLALVTELGGVIDTSGSIWEGHASVPLIIDDRIYFRAGSYLYVAESDTGFILNSVPSAEAKDYYHQIGYGGGAIIDYKTGKVYDTDLNLMYTLERSVTGVQYYDGMFYTSGTDIYSFTPGIDSTVKNGIKEMQFIAHVNNVYSTYGFTTSVFAGHYNYRIVADGFERGIAAVDLCTGDVNVKYFNSIRSMYLDDGWISYHDGCIYLPAYTIGLFGEVATDSDDCLVYIAVNGLEFGEEHSYVFEGKRGWVSETLFYGDRMFICASGILHSFKIVNGLIDPNSLITATLNPGHGSIVMDVSHSDDPDPVLYFYGIPYQTNNVGLSMVEYRAGAMTSYEVRGLPVNYNSQAVRADIDGRMIWYNDSGHIFDYTVPEKNVFYFLIDDGMQAQWFAGYGKTAAAALKSLGNNVIVIDDYLRITSIYGNSSSDIGIWALKQNAQQDITDNLKDYSWVKIYDLYDRSYDVCHYYRITTSSSLSQTYSYIDADGTLKQYLFEDNIGDRGMVGVKMVPGTAVKTIKYFDEDGNEFLEFRSIYLPENGVSWDQPNIIKDGVSVRWYDENGVAVDSLKGIDLSGDDINLYGSWKSEKVDLNIKKDVGYDEAPVLVQVAQQTAPVYLKVMLKSGSVTEEYSYDLNQDNGWAAELSIDYSDGTMLLFLTMSRNDPFEYNVGYSLLNIEAIA